MKVKLFAGSLSLLLITSCGGSSSQNQTMFEVSSEETVLNTCGRVLGPLKIMPMGDSITEGEEGHNTYRRPLWRNLLSAGCNVDFVGNRTGVSTGSRDSLQVAPPSPDFDKDHEGRWGYTSVQLRPRAIESVIKFAPDVILLHIGTNDILRGASTEEAIDNISNLLGDIYGARQGVVIMLAQVIHSDRGTEKLKRFNEALLQLVSIYPELIIVDQSEGYSPSDNYDGIHPGPSGESKLADKWANAILALN